MTLHKNIIFSDLRASSRAIFFTHPVLRKARPAARPRFPQCFPQSTCSRQSSVFALLNPFL